jgi:quinoprotein glucose dehydrogenase
MHIFRFIARAYPAILLSVAIASPLAQAQSRKSWLDYAGGADSSHYFPLSGINKSNVGQLEVAWQYKEGGAGFNPIVAGNQIYVLTQTNALAALDATTGKEIWIHANLAGITARGVNYWESKDHKDRRLIFSINSFLQEIDANTGKSIATFGDEGVVNLREGLDRDPNSLARVMSNTPGKVFEDVVILGSAPGESFLTPPGDIRAYNVITGKLAWQFHTVPLPGEYGADTIPKDGRKYIGAANVWGEFTLDDKRGIIFFPTGSMTYDFYGADRVGADLFGNCLIALDARTGKRLWHFQTVHHDLWDYDNVSAPQLITMKKDGKTIDAVALAGKTGFLYVFDRVTGQPVWPIEERPVPKSDVPGEKSWPTQPFPTAPPPFARQKFGVDDISPYISDEERAVIKDQILSSRNEGIFTPPSFRGTVSMPGNQGGSNWGTSASNPAKGMVFVLSVDEPAYLKLSKDTPINGGSGPTFGWGRGGKPGTAAPPSSPGQALYQTNCQGCHGEDRGGTGSVPSLVGIAARLPLSAIRETVMNGKGMMPAFTSLSAGDFSLLSEYLVNPGGGGRGRGMMTPVTPTGPVVASGGAPGMAAAVAAFNKAREGSINYGSMQGPPYPAGVDVPEERYFSGWGVSAYAVSAPFTSLVAYDLNKGTIKWKVPIGDDPQLAAKGITGTGAHSLRTGIIPTAGGLVFVAGGDGKLRAYDEDTGKVLFERSFGGGSRGIPVMYEANGREFLVISSAAGGGRPAFDASGAPVAAKAPDGPMGYIAFALPKK